MALLEILNRRFDGIPAWSFALRLALMAAQIILVICLGRRGVLFFYQAF
jgi:hypothetical protein